MTLGWGGFALLDAQGNQNRFQVLAFETTVQDSACVGLVGTCIVTVVNIRSSGGRRRLQSAAQDVEVSVAREYDFLTSLNATTPVADLVVAGGIAVTTSETMALSATSTVTSAGTPDSSPVTNALTSDVLGAALATRLPTVGTSVSSATIEPPSMPPPPEPSPPAPHEPSPSPPSPAHPWEEPYSISPERLLVFGLGILLGSVWVALMIGGCTYYRSLTSKQKRPSGGLAKAVSPTTKSTGWADAATALPATDDLSPSPDNRTVVESMGRVDNRVELERMAVQDVGPSHDEYPAIPEPTPAVRDWQATRDGRSQTAMLKSILEGGQGADLQAQALAALRGEPSTLASQRDPDASGLKARLKVPKPELQSRFEAQLPATLSAQTRVPRAPATEAHLRVGERLLAAELLALPQPSVPPRAMPPSGLPRRTAPPQQTVPSRAIPEPGSMHAAAARPSVDLPAPPVSLKAAADQRWADFQRSNGGRTRAPMLAARLATGAPFGSAAQVLPNHHPTPKQEDPSASEASSSTDGTDDAATRNEMHGHVNG